MAESKKAKCRGCYNDVYNNGCGGAKECWMLKFAKSVWGKLIHVDEMPPYSKKGFRRYLECYAPQRMHLIKKDKMSGYLWK